MRAVPAAMRMEQRGFKLDVEAHARLLADLEQERLAAEQEYREACLASGHTALADKAPSTPAQKERSAHRSAFERRTGALATDGEIGSALDQTQRTASRRPLPADPGAGEALPHRQAVVLLRADAGRAGVAGHRPNPRALSGRQHSVGPRQLRWSQLAANSARPSASARSSSPSPATSSSSPTIARWSCAPPRYISGDRAMTEAFEQGLDLHKITAARMTGKAPEEVTDEERRGAKAVNFGATYGIGAAALVQIGVGLVRTRPRCLRSQALAGGVRAGLPDLRAVAARAL